MKTDPIRIKSYFAEIRKNSLELNQLIAQNQLRAESLPLKAAKYLLIELAEAMSNTIQHILAKEKGVAVSGYIDSVVKAHPHWLISADMFQRSDNRRIGLKPNMFVMDKIEAIDIDEGPDFRLAETIYQMKHV